MTKWAVLPVKKYSVGKSRLSAFYSESKLTELNRYLFESTFTKLKNILEPNQILVVSQEEAALNWCSEHGGVALAEVEPSSLNSAVAQAQQYIKDHGGGQVLVLPSDLPLMTATDINSLLSLGDGGRKLVIIPDHYQSGTNALLMSEPDLIQPRFGAGSFRKHTKQALMKKAELIVYLNENIQWDLDTSLELCRIIEAQSEPSLLNQFERKNHYDTEVRTLPAGRA